MGSRRCPCARAPAITNSAIISTPMRRRGWIPASLPPQELADLVKELDHVFTSGRPRAHQSAQALAPHAELVVDPLFAEAPLASPEHSAAQDAGAQMGGGGAGALACRLSSRDRELPQSQAPRRPGRRHPDRQGARKGEGRQIAGRCTCCAWLLQRHDRPHLAPARLHPYRCAPGALLERRDLSMGDMHDREETGHRRRGRHAPKPFSMRRIPASIRACCSIPTFSASAPPTRAWPSASRNRAMRC